jgi:transglutaminase-like putative cysteine protease
MRSPRPFTRRGALHALCLLVALVCACVSPAFARGEKDWKPIDPSQLAMTAPLVEKDADAEAIFWEVKVDYDADAGMTLNHYVRVKIFNDRGRESQSKIDIAAAKVRGFETVIKDIAARTVKPDGSIVELKKEDIFERTVVKTSGVKVKVKTFAMPAVEPGAIIEYRWREVRRDAFALYEEYEFSREIPVQQVKYFIKPLANIVWGMNAQTFHTGSQPFQKEKDGFWSMTVNNVPAFREEPRMPPEHAVRPWMLVYYSPENVGSPAQFWRTFGKEVYEEHKPMMKAGDDIKRIAAEITAGAATDDEKIDRIFDFVRSKVKNVFDASSGFTSDQIEKMKDNKNPSDTLKRGVGNWHDIDMLFAALATAAGFDARVAKVPDRSENFFDPSFPNSYFIRSPKGTENVAVNVGGAWRFYDPGSTYVTKGMLRWQEEGQQALVSDPKEPLFVMTPTSQPDKSIERRTAKLKLSEDGTLEGDVRIEYTGHLAVDMKAANDDDSPAEREETLKNKYKARLSGVEITNIQIENVTDPVKPFVYSFHVVAPGYAQRTGKRLFLQPAFFQHGAGALFPTSGRRHDVYFHYPWSEEDRVEIVLPEGFALDNPESPSPISAGELSKYEPKAQITKDGRTLIYSRRLYFGSMRQAGGSSLLFPTTTYPSLKAYFDEIHKQDGHTMALKQGAAAATPGTSSN